jgi:Zn ribbon nucleic-acid-binding protein
MHSICPQCGVQNDLSQDGWEGEEVIPIECFQCGDLYLQKVTIEDVACIGVKFEPKVETNLKIGSVIYIHNKQHQLNLQRGRIIDKDHCNYRVQLVSGIRIWFPHNCVIPLPDYKV